MLQKPLKNGSANLLLTTHISIEKDINQYQKISVGYNFTDFSSDLSQLSYKSKGFFINFVGRF